MGAELAGAQALLRCPDHRVRVAGVTRLRNDQRSRKAESRLCTRTGCAEGGDDCNDGNEEMTSHRGQRGIPVFAQLRPMAMRSIRFAVAFGPRRIARPVALNRASRNSMLVIEGMSEGGVSPSACAFKPAR
jgi:hypothetical protein